MLLNLAEIDTEAFTQVMKEVLSEAPVESRFSSSWVQVSLDLPEEAQSSSADADRFLNKIASASACSALLTWLSTRDGILLTSISLTSLLEAAMRSLKSALDAGGCIKDAYLLNRLFSNLHGLIATCCTLFKVPLCLLQS